MRKRDARCVGYLGTKNTKKTKGTKVLLLGLWRRRGGLRQFIMLMVQDVEGVGIGGEGWGLARILQVGVVLS